MERGTDFRRLRRLPRFRRRVTRSTRPPVLMGGLAQGRLSTSPLDFAPLDFAPLDFARGKRDKQGRLRDGGRGEGTAASGEVLTWVKAGGEGYIMIRRARGGGGGEKREDGHGHRTVSGTG